MNIFEYFNSALGSCLIIIVIAIDYLRKYNIDTFQRKLLIVMLGALSITTIFDFLGLTLERNPGIYLKIFGISELPTAEINNKLNYIWSIYLVARNCSYYYGAVFIDYFAHGNIARTKKFFKFVTIFIIIYFISVIPNLKYGYYFYISRDNIYIPGTLYLLQILISYLPIILILIDISLAPKYIKRTQVLLTIFFVIITAIGAAVDIVLRTTNLIWPCVTAALLYMYFFIIRTDSKIDSLTGIGNRNNFYEYINKLTKQSTKKEYAFIKIDLEDLNEINNTHGYLEGDNALRDLSTIIKSSIRHTDFAVRYGGDEFIIIIAADNNANRIIERINETMSIQNNKKLRPYQLKICYSSDIYSTNTEWQIQEFLTHLDKKIQENK